MPVFPPAVAITSTRLVRSHSKVPSDSGKSVGIVKAETSIRSMGTALDGRGISFHTMNPGAPFDASAVNCWVESLNIVVRHNHRSRPARILVIPRYRPANFVATSGKRPDRLRASVYTE